jgi:hypothetical protein
VLCERSLVLGLYVVVIVPPGDRRVEESQIIGRFNIVTQRLERPDDHIAVCMAILNA